jgi:hypothetical protein
MPGSTATSGQDEFDHSRGDLGRGYGSISRQARNPRNDRSFSRAVSEVEILDEALAQGRGGRLREPNQPRTSTGYWRRLSLGVRAAVSRRLSNSGVICRTPANDMLNERPPC